MATWVALFRGINVVGRRMLPMKALVSLLEDDGFKSVRSYIQSGNVVFRAPGGRPVLAARIAALVSNSYGFEPICTRPRASRIPSWRHGPSACWGCTPRPATGARSADCAS